MNKKKTHHIKKGGIKTKKIPKKVKVEIESETSHIEDNEDEFPKTGEMCDKKFVGENIMLIGDIHFQSQSYEQGEEFIEKCLNTLDRYKPKMVVLMGDILDTFGDSKQSPFNQCYNFIDKITSRDWCLALFIIMGNHDLMNNTQFLSDKHFFNPYKKWPKVVVVDIPIHLTFQADTSKDRNIVMCPYVYKGRFKEALDRAGTYYTLSENDGLVFLKDKHDKVDYSTVHIIMCHQEFKGVKYGNTISSDGDALTKNLKKIQIITGHIHEKFSMENIRGIGSARQVKFDEPPNKSIVSLSFSDEYYDPKKEEYIDTEINLFKEVDLHLKVYKELHYNFDSEDDDLSSLPSIKDFDFEACQSAHIKVLLHATPEQTKIFRHSLQYKKLISNSVKVNFVNDVGNTEDDENAEITSGGDRLDIKAKTFDEILLEKVSTFSGSESETVKSIYNEIKGDE